MKILERLARVEADNPWILIPENVPLGPDGDVLPESTDGFRIEKDSMGEVRVPAAALLAAPG